VLQRWLRRLIWQPFATFSSAFPIVPLRATVTQPVDGVVCIRIDNVVTRMLGRFSGGYDYAVCYLLDGEVLVDTGFAWARRSLRQTLRTLGADASITTVVNTHYHEDHTGNNALVRSMTGARVLAHRDAIAEIRFPSRTAWYRSFLFGPSPGDAVEPVGDVITTRLFRFEVHHLPGHCPGHLCLFEPTRGWLFSGDLYIAADLDSQLSDADGPLWIESLERAIDLRPRCLFDAHGVIVTDEREVRALLERKRDFLVAIRERVRAASSRPQSIEELTGVVFAPKGLVDLISLSDGWMSLITGSDFSRSNLVRSFLRAEIQASTQSLTDGAMEEALR
jgi:glyoxylase-like metal-dependent hydrolase (beta-lactamase superfamily II)